MRKEKSLREMLCALVLEYGGERVERALVEIRETTDDKTVRGRHSHARSNTILKSSAEPPKRAKTTAPSYVSKMKVPADVMVPLEEVARRFDNKSFLPTYGEVRNFCEIHGVEVPSSRSRVATIPCIFKHLSQLTPQEIQLILETKSFSGPTQLAPIAAAIRRTSEQRTRDKSSERDEKPRISLSEREERRSSFKALSSFKNLTYRP